MDKRGFGAQERFLQKTRLHSYRVGMRAAQSGRVVFPTESGGFGMKRRKLGIEELEQRIAPGATGQLGYEGQPGNQGNGSNGYEGQPGNQGNGLKGYEGQPGNQGG